MQNFLPDLLPFEMTGHLHRGDCTWTACGRFRKLSPEQQEAVRLGQQLQQQLVQQPERDA